MIPVTYLAGCIGRINEGCMCNSFVVVILMLIHVSARYLINSMLVVKANVCNWAYLDRCMAYQGDRIYLVFRCPVFIYKSPT